MHSFLEWVQYHGPFLNLEEEALLETELAATTPEVGEQSPARADYDNLVSEMTAPRAQLKAANDNDARMGAADRVVIEWLERKWSRPERTRTE
jgi:hypothetical protein